MTRRSDGEVSVPSRLEKLINSLLKPPAFRAGLTALAISLGVSGGAYAAVMAGGDAAAPTMSSQARLMAIGAGATTSASSEASSGLDVSTAAPAVASETVESSQAHGTVKKETDSLDKGETKVETQGVDGLTRTTYRVVSADGKETSRVAVATVVVTEKVDEVVLVGTHVAETTADSSTSSSSSSSTTSSASTASSSTSSSSSASSAASSGVWAALAQCESGGNPSTNTGNGYYGLYQFSLSTWQALGGTGLPSDASAAEQTRIAQKLQAQSGWGQWPSCAASLGLL